MRWWLALVAGCFHSNGVECSDGTVCPPGLECAPEVGGCLDPGACSSVPDGTACGTTGACEAGTCSPAACGNGRIERDEVCDDGNLLSHDGCSSTCQPEALRWTPLDLGSNSCATGAIATYDVMRGCVLVFGPYTGCTAEIRGTTSTPLASQPGTTARLGEAAAYDNATGVTMLFGGSYTDQKTGNPIYEGDTRTWSGSAWMLPSPAASPSPRAYHAIVSLPGGGALLFGGQDPTPWLGDTWRWNGSNWAAVPTSTAPAARYQHAMAYDARHGYALLYGGISGSAPAEEDTWAWDGTTWHELLAASPIVGRQPDPAMTYDPVRGRVLLVQNSGASAVFEWDGAAWQQIVALDPMTPPGALAYDALESRFIMLASNVTAFSQGRWDYAGEVDETCMAGVDADGDGLAGCADPDCWARCTPYCPPGAPCDPNAPHCGDGTCNAALEQGVCPADCP